MDKIFKIKKKMVEIQDGRYSSGLYKKGFAPHMFGCPLYIHNTKKGCFVRLKWCPYAPIPLDAPICLNAPLYLGMAPKVWMPPVCLDAPICLDGPCMFGCPHMPLLCFNTSHVWMPPVCLDTALGFNAPICLDAPCTYTTQRKDALSD